jgi:murein DD-endopeptidase MepM/ murein hydrolase activator NlpD
MRKKWTIIGLIVGLASTLGWLSNKSWAQPSPLWQFPLNPPSGISRGFEPPLHNWLPGHRGVDLQAHSGQGVFAPENGTVIYVQAVAGRGVVVIKHGWLRTTYEPVTSNLTVGDQVFRGDLIGRVSCGSNHCCIGSSAKCLHWGLLRGHQYLNPLRKVDIHIRLLPIEPALANYKPINPK